MDLATALRWTTERYPHRRAVGGPAPLSYAEWDARTERYAHALHELGAIEGSRAMFMLQGGEPLATLHLAAQKARVTSLPLSTRIGTEELAYCIGDCDPALIAVDEHTHDLVVGALEMVEKPPPLVWAGHRDHAPAGVLCVARVAERAPTTIVPTSPQSDDISVMLYTSGTTGRPKASRAPTAPSITPRWRI